MSGQDVELSSSSWLFFCVDMYNFKLFTDRNQSFDEDNINHYTIRILKIFFIYLKGKTWHQKKKSFFPTYK